MVGPVNAPPPNVAALSASSPVAAQFARGQQGHYRGETVIVSSGTSKLQDLAEEVGMGVAHRLDKRSLERREVRRGQGAHLEALARIGDYYDRLPDMPHSDRLLEFVEAFQAHQKGNGASSISKEEIFNLLNAFDPDPTHQFAALEIARDYFDTAGASGEQRQALFAAYRDYVSGDLGREVRAGLAAAKAASEAALALNTEPAAIRESYRAMLRERKKNLGQLFGVLREFDILGRLEEVVDTFVSIVGSDLGGTGPSTDRTYLQSLLGELSGLKKMRSLLAMAADTVSSTDRLMRSGENASGDVADVAGHVLNFCSKLTANPQDARQMLSRYGACSAATRLAFANGLRALHAEIPDGAIPTPQARLQQSEAILGMLDNLVGEEESEYEHAQDANLKQSPF